MKKTCKISAFVILISLVLSCFSMNIYAGVTQEEMERFDELNKNRLKTSEVWTQYPYHGGTLTFDVTGESMKKGDIVTCTFLDEVWEYTVDDSLKVTIKAIVPENKTREKIFYNIDLILNDDETTETSLSVSVEGDYITVLDFADDLTVIDKSGGTVDFFINGRGFTEATKLEVVIDKFHENSKSIDHSRQVIVPASVTNQNTGLCTYTFPENQTDVNEVFQAGAYETINRSTYMGIVMVNGETYNYDGTAIDINGTKYDYNKIGFFSEDGMDISKHTFSIRIITDSDSPYITIPSAFFEMLNEKTPNAKTTLEVKSRYATVIIPADFPQMAGYDEYNGSNIDYKFVFPGNADEKVRMLVISDGNEAEIPLIDSLVRKAKSENISFSDVADTHWAVDYITEAAERYYIGGYGDGQFMPEKNVSRAEFLQMIMNAFYFKDGAECPYTDVKDDAWYSATIKKAYSAGLLTAFSGDTFSPDKAITREEMAAVTAALIKAVDIHKNTHYVWYLKRTNNDLSMLFKDYGSISESFVGAVTTVYNYNIMRGVGNEMYDPQGYTTRAQAVIVVIRLLEAFSMLS